MHDVRKGGIAVFALEWRGGKLETSSIGFRSQVGVN